MRKLLKNAIILILCVTFTPSLFGVLSTSAATSSEVSKLFEAQKDLLRVTEECAKEIVCKELKISKELLDEVIRDVDIVETFNGKTEYIPVRNIILVGVWDMLLDEYPCGENRGSKLAREIALAFIDNYLYKDREEVLCKNVMIKAFADLCDKNIVPSKETFSNKDIPSCCDRKQIGKILKSQNRSNLKYLAQKWLSEEKITPIEVLDKIKAGESAKDILIETGGQKVFENWLEENTFYGVVC